ncbi:hypothetical protein B188_06740 [Candidatus Brocadiaceae bacterium B188]|nr:transporter [Candidatus Brocadia sapporoensis]QQR67863.1 MAG: transporter [Candidatus Brocadia sp.]TWU52716.1 hypothetical protein B188_06740 [Candidatus Brocadiaceae bacterium B188]
MRIFGTFFLVIFFTSGVAYAHGECCLSRSLCEATTSNVITATNFGLSLQYEYSNMETIREGSHSRSPNSVLDDVASTWPKMPKEEKSFSVPTRMIMQKYTLLGTYSATKRFQFMATIPYVINDMDMKMVMRSPMGMDMKMKMEMDAVEGFGDMTLMGLYKVYTDNSDFPTKKLTAGMGLKLPTGKNDEETDSGHLVHAMMQPGTGSWDPIFLMNYMHTLSPVILQTNLMYHLTTKGDEGYEFGDKVSLDLVARYPIAGYLNPGLELNLFHAGQDKDHDGKYSRPDVSLIDNPDNTGITSVSITPSLQIRIPKTGGSIDLKFQQPLYQHARGVQQVVDWRAMASIVWAF